MHERIAVAGGGLAAHRLIGSLRRRGHDGDIVLVGAEPHLPYDRPPLSKQFLTGDDDTLTYDPHVLDGVDVRLGVSATRLDTSLRTLDLSDGSSVRADQLVIATGATPRRLPAQPELAGLITFRTRGDAEDLRNGLEGASRLAVVGAGFIGSEIASTARSAGLEVTVLEADDVPLGRGVGRRVGASLARLVREAGVDLRLGVRVDGIEAANRHVRGVRLADGVVVEADLVVVGIGARPETAWLEGSGVRLQDGVVTDDRCRAVGAGGHVWAVGDVARWPSKRYGTLIRTEHWTGAMEHARTAAANLTGADLVHDPVPYVWSDQFGHKIQVLGLPNPDDDVVVLSGDLDGDSWVVAFVRLGRVVAAASLDQPRLVMGLRPLIHARVHREELHEHTEDIG